MKSESFALALNTWPLQFGFLFVDFFVEFFDFLADFVAVFGVGIEIEVALVGFDGGLSLAFLFVCFTQIEEGNRVAGLRRCGVFKAVDGGVHVASFHVVLAYFEIFFCAPGIPLGLVWSRVHRGIYVFLWLGLRFVGRRRARWRLLGVQGCGKQEDTRHRSSQEWAGMVSASTGLLPLIRFSLFQVELPGQDN